MTKYEAQWPDGYRVIWRNLSWAEFRKLRPLLASDFTDPMDLYMQVYKTCRLEGPVLEVVPAGIAVWIGRQQMQGNPFEGKYEDLQRMVNLARAAVGNDYLLSTKAFVASTLHIPMAEIDQMDVEEYFTRVAQAELILNAPLNPVNPNPPEKPKTVRKRGPSG